MRKLIELLNSLLENPTFPLHAEYRRRPLEIPFIVGMNKTLRNVLFMPYGALTRSRIVRAFDRLAELALAAGLTLEISFYGEAVFTLVYGSRDATKDIDAIVRPKNVAIPLIRQVAQEQNLPADWLNEQVGQFIAARQTQRARKHGSSLF